MKNQFCYREPNFPETIYLSVFIITGKDDIRFIYPMKEIALDLKSVQKEAKGFNQQLSKIKDASAKILGVIVIKIKLKRKSPLTKEDWTEMKKDFLIDEALRKKEFSKMMAGVYQFYNVIILPRHYDTKTKQWQFTNWLPVTSNTDDEKLHQIARSSEEQVDISAKSVGVYSIEFIKGFNMKTGKFFKTKNSDELLN